MSESGAAANSATMDDREHLEYFPARAYLTFMAGVDDHHLQAVVRLARGLREEGSAYPLVVAVHSDVAEDHRRALRSEDCIVREVEPVVHATEDQSQFAIDYSKCLLQLPEYDKVAYLDAARTKVQENMDVLFELESGHMYVWLDDVDPLCDHKAWLRNPSYKIPYLEESPALPAAEAGNVIVFVHEPGKSSGEALLKALGAAGTIPFAELLVSADNATIAETDGPPVAAARDKVAFAAHVSRNLPLVGLVAASSAIAGLAAGTVTPAVGFGLFLLFLGGLFLVTLPVIGA